MNTRCKVRISVFGIALVAVLGAKAWIYRSERNALQISLQNSYSRAVADLAQNVNDIEISLNKGIYCASGEMMTKLAGDLQTGAEAAKVCLSQLPMSKTKLENTYKFLSQVGDYSKNISKKMSQGETLSEEEYNNMLALYEYSKKLSEDMFSVEEKMNMGVLSFEQLENSSAQAVSVASGFEDFEDSFEKYPSLIYDGPFSDHILEREPVMTKGKPEVSADEAMQKAIRVTKSDKLTLTGESSGRMPSYEFSGDNITASVSKNGGYMIYFIKDRSVGEAALSNEQAVAAAQKYLQELGISDMKSTYFETVYNTCTINFAAVSGDTTIYTDLIKVSVALDNGEITSFDARGYLVNHTERDLPKALISADEAKSKISPALTAQKVSKAVIPTDGQNEKAVYEVACAAKNGQTVLVYINQETGVEEQVLILLISESGQLTV